MRKNLSTLEKQYHFGYHSKCCSFCRYYRYHPWTAECLLLGRTIAVGDEHWTWESCQSRVCDLWKKRPKIWEYICTENPHWKDKYYPRKQLERMRSKL